MSGTSERLDRVDAILDRCRDRGNVRLSHLEMARNELAELTEEHSALVAEVEQLRATSEVVWLTKDDEGNFGVWRDPDNARQQIIQGWSAETPGDYEWVNDPDGAHEVLLRDSETAGVMLWMALVADAAPQWPECGEQLFEAAPCCGGPHAGWIHAADCANPEQPDHVALCSVAGCLHSDHQREQQPERGADADGVR